VQEVGSLLARKDVAALPDGVIHGDLFRDNVLFNERGLTGVLDFHHAARGTLLFDLAVAANDWCSDSSGVLDPERTLTLLRAYHQIRPLLSAEAIFFPAYALYAALTFWLSRLTVAADRAGTDNRRFNNPQEFERVVRQRRAHFYYVDERLLGA
jgi:homoserine kinase type II